jgi:serine/threonine-protein kinase
LATELRKTPEPNLPKQIGRYEAFLQIGAGGMARVYLAVQRGQTNASDVVVVKVLRREVVEDEHVLALFMDEARIATRLRHPNVILTREVVAEPPDYLLAMEFHDGQSLLQVLRRLGRNAVPLDEHIWIISKVLAGLSHAHELKDNDGRALGIVHRDVSPSNVLVCYTGEIKLIDFGIAKATGALAATQDGVVKGKLGYAAPEQCLGKPADPRSDIYAVGVMVWEAIAGRRRASGETWHSVLQARIEDSEPTLQEVCPDAPADLCAIAEKALAHEPEARYQTAREFQSDLEAYLTAQHARIGPARIAALLRPHFEQDRADQRRAIEGHVNSLRSHTSGQHRRVPLPGPMPPPEEAVPLSSEQEIEVEEEDTSRIPVDDALLIKSRRGSLGPPALDGAPAIPKMPLNRPPKVDAVVTSSGARSIPPGARSIPPGARSVPPGVRPSEPASARRSEPAAGLKQEIASMLKSEPPGTPNRESSAMLKAEIANMLRPEHEQPELGGAVVPDDSTRVEVPRNTRPSIASGIPSARFELEQYGAKKGLLARPQLLGAAAAAVAVLGIGGWLLQRGQGGAVSTEAAPSATAVAHAVQAAATGPGAGPTPNANQVRVRLSVSPPEAEMRLDGRLLKGNPFVSVFPRDDAIHELSAGADGYRDEKQVIQFIQDVDLQVSLRKARAGAPRVAAAAMHGAGPGIAAPARPTGEAHAGPAVIEPGMDLQTRPDNRAKHNIDEKDPYSQ